MMLHNAEIDKAPYSQKRKLGALSILISDEDKFMIAFTRSDVSCKILVMLIK